MHIYIYISAKSSYQLFNLRIFMHINNCILIMNWKISKYFICIAHAQFIIVSIS